MEQGTLVDDRYRILEPLGEGAMGRVYAARHVDLRLAVAIKVFHPHVVADPTARWRVEREALAAASIQCEHVVRVIDVGESDGVAFLVMERVAGPSLRALLRAQGALEPLRAIGIAEQIAEGLAAAHRAGVIHRDLKPSNVLLARGEVVKLVDFGIAKLHGAASKLTVTGQLLGTPAYMSPEQCGGEACDARTDIYAFGLVLYEMLRGRHPYQDRDPIVLLHRHQHTPAPALADAPPELAAIVARCLQKDKEARYASMDEVLDALDEARSAALDEARPTRRILPVPARASIFPTVVLGALAVLASLTFGLGAVHFVRGCDRHPRVASEPARSSVATVDASIGSFGAAPSGVIPALADEIAADSAEATEAPSEPTSARHRRRRPRPRSGHRSPLLDPWR